MSHQSLQPIVIQLNEVPDAGRHLIYTQETGELTSALKDLIGNKPYEIKLHIKPLGNVYEVSGEIRTKRSLTCSYCADEIDQDITENYQELLVIEKQRPRGSQSANTNHSSESLLDNGPFCNYLSSSDWSVAEFIHELIALTEPYQAYKDKDCLEKKCPNYLRAIKNGVFIPEDAPKPEEDKENNPFAVLEKVKIPTQ